MVPDDTQANESDKRPTPRATLLNLKRPMALNNSDEGTTSDAVPVVVQVKDEKGDTLLDDIFAAPLPRAIPRQAPPLLVSSSQSLY